MLRFDFDAVRSLAIAGVAALYSTMMLLVATTAGASDLGRLIV